MTRVEFTRPVASPTVSASAGQILDLEEGEALKRIELGHCVALEQPKQGLLERLTGRRKSEPEPQEPADKPLEKRTVEQLKAFADEHDISIPEDGKKADILAAITEALAQREATQE